MSVVCMQFANGQYFTLVLGGAGLADRQKRNQETKTPGRIEEFAQTMSAWPPRTIRVLVQRTA